ncbi:MAG: flagellar motor switch protein FliM [Candidatus Wallacebacter cryptica]
MEDILSQSEIDQLIQATLQPKDAIQEVIEDLSDAPYDFTKPNKFSKDQLRGLQRIHEQFSRAYSGLMSAKFRTRFELKFQAIDQLTFGEFVRSLPHPSVLSIFDASPLPGSIVVQLTPDSAFIMHDRLCGGRGESYGFSRSLSDIEMAVFKRQVITNFGKILSDAWKDVEAIDFKLQAVEHNPQFLQIATDRDVVVVVSLRFEFNEVTDSFNICIPFRTLEPVLSKITQHRLFESLTPPDPEKLAQLRERVKSAVLPIEVELGAAIVSVNDLLTLEIGDVIELDRKRSENVDVKVGSLTKFKGTPGKLGDKLGVVITSICESQEE